MAGTYSTKKVRLAHKRRKRKVFVFIVLCILLILSYAGMSFGLTHEKLAITTVEVTGNEQLEQADLRVVVEQGLAAVHALSLYGGTVFTYDDESITENLLNTYPRLASAALSMRDFHTLTLVVTERSPVAAWCYEDCFFIDKSGFVFERVDTVPEGLVTYTGDLAPAPLRQVFLHGDFPRLDAFMQDLREIGIMPIAVHIFDGEAEIVSAEHPLLKIKLDAELDRTLSYIEVTLASDDYRQWHSQAEEGEEVDSSEAYIDVRFGNRVYYK
jgi:hypothetical protein